MRRVRHGARWSVGHEFSFLIFTTGEMRDDVRDDPDSLDVTSHEPPKKFHVTLCPEAKIPSREAMFPQRRLAKS